jgi:hypothetical protein
VVPNSLQNLANFSRLRPCLTKVVRSNAIEHVVSQAKLVPILAILLWLFLLQVARTEEGMALGFRIKSKVPMTESVVVSAILLLSMVVCDKR